MYVKMDYTRADEVLVKVAADCPSVPLVHLVREDRATSAIDAYEHALLCADLSSAAAIDRLAGWLELSREAVSEFAKLSRAGNADVIDRVVRCGLWDEGARALHDQLVTLLRQRQAGA